MEKLEEHLTGHKILIPDWLVMSGERIEACDESGYHDASRY